MTPSDSIPSLLSALKTGSVAALSRAITLVESERPEDQVKANSLIDQILEFTGNTIRIGITGPPGVGKSTFIETFGTFLTALGKKIAVLTIDPSSRFSGGSILGDKTRMEKLSHDPLAYIRPSAAGATMGGLTRASREALLLCEAAGYELILIETVGIGQSDDAVRKMVDVFMLLAQPGAGDELQGMKRGIMELVDLLVITKADGSAINSAKAAQVMYQNALHLFSAVRSGWVPQALYCSAINGMGIEAIWQAVESCITATKKSGWFEEQRLNQRISWFHETFMHLVDHRINDNNELARYRDQLEHEVLDKIRSPREAATYLIARLFEQWNGNKAEG